MTQKHIILVSTAVQASNVTNACHKITATSLVTHMIIAQNFTPLLKVQLLFNSAFTVVNSYLPPFEKGVFPPVSLSGTQTWIWPGVAGCEKSKHAD